jgi:peptidoglycan biosynthesis protein MviN/MurJ (putative lipid II flippase)
MQSMPAGPLWIWAAQAAGVPLALPFAARSIASGDSAGALATFNYAWKLVELPLLLAIQLVATLAFPAIARALATHGDGDDRSRGENADQAALLPVRSAFALAWTLGCAAAGGLLWGAPALADLLFGWGRMDASALHRVAQWGRAGAWSLLPQAVIAVTLTVLAARARLRAAAVVYLVALVALLGGGVSGVHDGQMLMWLLDVLFLLVAVALVGVAGRDLVVSCIPWSAAAAALLALCAAELVRAGFAIPILERNMPLQLVLSGFVAIFVIAATALASPDLRRALRR